MMVTDEREVRFAQYRYLCVRGARKFARREVEWADCEQIAAVGLLKACDRFDAALKTPFEAFAWVFIVGELMHYVRDHQRFLRPPRRLWELERRLNRIHDEFSARHHREPSNEEIAALLGATAREVEDLLLFRAGEHPEPLHDLEPAQTLAHSYTPEDWDDRLVARAALDALTPTERIIVLGLYARGYTQTEISKRLGYSRRHISRLHRTALRKMQLHWVPQSA